MGGIGSWEVLIVFFVFVGLIVLITRVGSKRREDPSTPAEMDDLRNLADRMERRMENLETILTDRPYACREAQDTNAADRSDVL